MSIERIEVEPREDARDYEVGDEIFGRTIVRIDYERGFVWVEAPSRLRRFKHWLGRVWFLLQGPRH